MRLTNLSYDEKLRSMVAKRLLLLYSTENFVGNPTVILHSKTYKKKNLIYAPLLVV